MSGPPDFESLYRSDDDPWEVGSSLYEQRKLGLLLAGLLRPRYASAWDAACGTGHLAALLARRCDRVLATDASPRAVELTRVACADERNVAVEVVRLPDRPAEWSQPPDLVVLSEFFYYLSDKDRTATLRLVDEVAADGAELVAVHWRHVPEDAWLSGAAAQAEIVARLAERRWRPLLHHVDEEFLIDTLRRRNGPT